MNFNTNIVICNQQETASIKEQLNFANKNSIEKRENAKEKLIVAKDLLKISEEHEQKWDIEKAKADQRGSIQNSLEVIDLSIKSVLDADEKKQITDPRFRVKREDLESKHNIGAQVRSLNSKEIELLDKGDVREIYQYFGKEQNRRFPTAENGKPNYEQPYNAIRYARPIVSLNKANRMVMIAEKTLDRCNEMAIEQETFETGGKKYRYNEKEGKLELV